MKLTTLLIFTAILQVSAGAFAQKVTLSEKNTPLNKVFDKIRNQTGYDFLASSRVLKDAIPVNIIVTNEELKVVLDQIFSTQPLEYVIQEKIVVVSKKEHGPFIPAQTKQKLREISGKVTDATGAALPGATIRIKGTSLSTSAGKDGSFTITSASETNILIVSFVGYQSAEIVANINSEPIVIQLKPESNPLNQVQVIGYGTTTKRFNTGSVSTISSKDIESQPVTNVLSAISGRVPGAFVQTTNGLPGGNINIQIRGKGSVTAGTDPLYIIDGVPFGTTIGGNYTTSTGPLGGGSVNGQVSPFNSINPSDIESINILKDADATAIYGSRGANGVVLITTKKGKAGSAKLNVNISSGINKAANLPRLLNLSQYLQIRKEAFKNDGIDPSSDPNSENYAPDLTVWNGNSSTDWGKYLLGKTGRTNDAQVTISGGSENNIYTAGLNFHTESSYIFGDSRYQRGGLHFNFQHTSTDQRFFLQFSNLLTLDNNKLSNPPDISTAILLPPNYPLYDETGNYNWFYVNPAAESRAASKSTADNIVNNLLLSYKITPELTIKASAGYNQLTLKQTQLFPTVSLYPGSTNYTNFGNNSNRSIIVEPQINYAHHFNNSNLSLLLGGTFQNTKAQGEYINAGNFNSESLMENLSSAQTFMPSNSYVQYKYASIFGRATYNINSRYIFNATVRRDGSSRFGPGKQYGNFGSLGAAWVFSEENFFKNYFPLLSFGKIRASYGLTGNDQITDYQYLSAYGSSGYVYQGISGLRPNRIANDDFHWETTRKLDVALELGLLRNRILLNVGYYKNRSQDQLVSYKLPYLTGFANYQANLPAVVENIGWEIELSTRNIVHADFSWSTNFNLTIPRNRLVSFQNFETSSYAQTLALGYDITRIYGYQFIAVDPATGLASYANQPSSISPYLFNTIGKRTPDLYGGFGNTLSYRNISLDVFFQFSKQKAVGGLSTTPGILLNNYQYAINRWQKQGNQTQVPLSSTIPDPYFATSSANIFDASYARLKNIMLSYSFRGAWMKKAGISELRFYLQGQNIATIWHHNSPLVDPESGALTPNNPNLPPVKSFVGGIQLSL